ncbi:bifunctional diguanylate cyclase/phosphodiesterase [Roseobacter sp. OBYS 0001]|uniref:putative bifunctional diguanylate cyclase/phosphodiesterase n=1 Tax=Roseobacter sp. OBYS 0001 TaxID=882651 RepID=UPI001BBF5656|nr:GGDEF domain-containing phosphodiesterase [Roseobacter sp. OBYS 0001]GIT88955.1 hypothetical protein ROBYS_39710 [Roseobacter sp. OBYS 0001]
MLVFRFVVFGVVAAAAIWISVAYGVGRAVDNVIFRESVDKASQWGQFMASRIPDIEDLAESGMPTEKQRATIEDIRNIGDVFRFKLFTADGRLSLISDDVSTGRYMGTADVMDLEPMQVAATGAPIVDVFDGTNKPNRPDLYAEAYIPLFDGNGQVVAIVEVYVDQTATAAYFRESFQTFGLMLMLFCGLIFAVPCSAYYLQRTLTERSRKDAEFLSRFDPLTGLLNRREFSMQAKRHIENNDLSVACYLDLDHFKAINDTHGHSIGDAFLANVADVLRENCRKEDLIARFGGDEFVIGFQNLSIEDATHRVRSIVQMCKKQIDIEDASITGSVSVGLAEINAEDGLDVILKNADTALYHAKTSGRNNFAVYGTEMGEELKQRYALESRIRHATENSEFEIYFQPLVSSKDQQIIGHEALLRLLDDNDNFIPPSVFIPVAEDLGLIEEIGRWTIQTAIQKVAEAESDKMLAINLSPIQFKSGELVNTVCTVLKDTGFPAHQLELEITESLLLEDSMSVEMQIDCLRDMGVRIAMDDFGTGFSSLSYLWKYGFDRLKIDRSFVAALDGNSERSREIIESVVMLGARLNMKITAEGVETAEQSKFLSDLGCDTLQGFFYGKPSPFRDEFLETAVQIPKQGKTG